jgi:Single-strand binding protein family
MHSLRSGLQLEARPGRTGASINHHTEGNQMPRNKPGLKVVDDGNEESGRKSRGPAVNRVTLVGRLAGDPELHYTPSGTAVTQLRLATNEGEEPEFHSLSAWGNLAEFPRWLRIFSAYGQPPDRLWVITEADRSLTTILRPDEY